MEKEKKGIFSRLKLIYIVITLIAGATILIDLAISVFWVGPFVKDLEEKFLDYELIQAKRAAYVVESFIDQAVRNSEEIAVTVGTVGEKTKETEYILDRFLRDNPDIRTVSIIDASGQEIKKMSVSEVFTPTDLKDLSGSVEFIYAATKELYVGPVYFSQSAEPFLNYRRSDLLAGSAEGNRCPACRIKSARHFEFNSGNANGFRNENFSGR
jgi:hypothetical protein